MIILDTNVLSELIRHSPDHNVIAWLDALDTSDIGTTSVTAAELLYGVARLPDGARKDGLAAAIHAMIDDDFAGRVRPFDVAAAAQYALVAARRAQAGRPVSVADAQIAAICRELSATLATRNTRDFEETGIELLNPWLP